VRPFRLLTTPKKQPLLQAAAFRRLDGCSRSEGCPSWEAHHCPWHCYPGLRGQAATAGQRLHLRRLRIGNFPRNFQERVHSYCRLPERERVQEEQYQRFSTHADTRLSFQPIPGSEDTGDGICPRPISLHCLPTHCSFRRIKFLLVIFLDR
jgi:hypothetical protein